MLSSLDPAVAVVHALLVQLTAVLPGTPGIQVIFAFVLITLAFRAAMLPLSLRAYRSQEVRKTLAPELGRLQRRHADDPRRLAKEIGAVHRRAGTSPFAGFGPMLLQAPVFAVLYRLVMTPTVSGHVNALTSAQVLSTPLSAHWLPVLLGAGPLSAPALLFGLLGGGLLLVAFLLSRRIAEGPTVLRLLPFGSVAFALVAPVGFTVYLLTSTSWTLLERGLLPRLA